MDLTELERLFMNAYFSNGGKATEAYLTVRPQISRRSASVMACRLLKRPKILEALNTEMDKHSVTTDSLKEKRITEFLEIKNKAMKGEKLGTAVNALDKVCNIEGHYRHDDPESDEVMYLTALQKISVNVDNRHVNIRVDNQENEINKS